MSARRILIVEDEVIIAQHLRSLLQRLGYEVVAHATRASQALELLRQHQPDLLLIDVMLRGELDGIDLAGRLRAEHAVPFVFVTSLADAATVARAKQTRPYGYLIKPFNEQEVYVTLELAFTAFADEQAAPAPAKPADAAPLAATAVHDSIFVRDRRQLTKVSFTELLWLQADGNYTSLFTADSKYTVSSPLKLIEDRLPATDFVRIHKSYIVALSQITALDAQGVRIGDKSIPVGRAYQADLMSRLNLLGTSPA
ncbi:LytR/AlgR family response regulator transcription factor [Hymenobacter weizhouensis]|uniref:LytR/AlgR family response regulator transcription factor n=1 Tax=Hymenobacter sp. YIM 151500-1 TaxID=2987689 RepID=UPI002226F9F6|nr:response regulator [Hymenobacter sp. YIM 151500-1]UYZ63731.1 response regulator [Hymenobacter sp. YIM 151500-1]